MLNCSVGNFTHLRKANLFSLGVFENLSSFNNNPKYNGACLAVFGSLGRLEASEASDFDVYPLVISRSSGEASATSLWNEAFTASGLRNPSVTGSFGAEKVIATNEIMQPIGGDGDTNKSISRRILLILESKFIGDSDVSETMLDSIAKRYIQDGTTNHQLGMFLLNDIIRFYRTMCVDFEYKTVEEGKPWAVRNLKLVFSRKMIYFSGLLMCAELAQASDKQKRNILIKFMRMTPIERLCHILGSEADKALYIYDEFIGRLSDPEFRLAINNVSASSRGSSSEFTDLKNRSHHFTWALRSAFNRHYDSTHPIHKALMF